MEKKIKTRTLQAALSLLYCDFLSDASDIWNLSKKKHSLHLLNGLKIEIWDSQITGYPYLKTLSKLDLLKKKKLVPTIRNAYFLFLSNFRFN